LEIEQAVVEEIHSVPSRKNRGGVQVEHSITPVEINVHSEHPSGHTLQILSSESA
jgi:hypothetical protein